MISCVLYRGGIFVKNKDFLDKLDAENCTGISLICS